VKGIGITISTAWIGSAGAMKELSRVPSVYQVYTIWKLSSIFA
jgi:hypothetical protein